MKKILIAICLVASASFFASCKRAEPDLAGGTAIQKMAGFWDVRVDVVDKDNNYYEDPFGLGVLPLMTYNTSDNSSTEMWIDDMESFWSYKFKVDVSYPDRVFHTKDEWRPYDAANTGNAVVYSGKILEGKGHNVHGQPCDSIAFVIKFSDETDDTIDHYQVCGIRHGGYEAVE